MANSIATAVRYFNNDAELEKFIKRIHIQQILSNQM